MKTLIILSITILLFTSIVSATSVTRSFSNSSFVVDESLTVTVTVKTTSKDKIINYGIIEYVSQGFNITNISTTDFYYIDGNNITWIVYTINNNTYVNKTKTIKYTLIPINKDKKIFNGSAIFTATYPIMEQKQYKIIGSKVIKPSKINNSEAIFSRFRRNLMELFK